MARGRPTLKQRIALDGGKEIEDELKALGKVGEQAFEQLKQGAKSFEGPGKVISQVVKRLKDEMKRLRAAGKRVGDGFRTLGRRSRALRQSLARVGRRFALVAAAGLAAAAAVLKFVQSSAAAADAARKTAQGVGITVDALGRLAFAGEQSGLSQEQLVKGITRFNQALGEAALEERKAGKATEELGDLTDRAREAYEQFGVTVRDAREAIAGTNKELGATEVQGSLAARALQRLGIAVLDATGEFRPFNEVFFEFADAIAALPDGIEKSATVIDIFGSRLAVKMIPLLNQGSEAIRAFGVEADLRGLIFSPEEARLGEVLIDTLNRLKTFLVGGGVLKGLSKEIGLLFAPSVIEAVNALTAALQRNRAAIVEFASDKVKQAIALAEDLVAAIQGRDVDVREPFILEARDAVVAFARDLRDAWENIIRPTFEALFEILDKVAAGINAVFGTDLTGRQIAIAIVVAQLLGAFTTLAAAVGVVAGAVVVVISLFGLLASPIAAVIAVLAAAAIAAAVFWDDIAAGAKQAFDFILAVQKDKGKLIRQAFRSLTTGIADLWASAMGAIGNVTDALADRIKSAFKTAVAVVKGLLNSLISLARRAFKAAKEALGFKGGGTPAPTPVLAGGGQVRGPGTPTSDSIPAWLSTTEFVMQGKAVAHYGARFMHAINEMRLPKDFPGFALGGFVESLERSFASLAPVPAFQTGGLAESLAAVSVGRPGTPVTLVLDGQPFALRGDDAIVEALGRTALREERSRIGALPSWHSG